MLKDFIDVVIGVAVIVGFIVVFMAMYTAVLERTREIGIIKAVGGSSGLVLGLLLRETLLLAVVGTLLGIALTYGTQWLMKHWPRSLVQETVYYLVADCGRDCDCGRDAGGGGSRREGGEAGCDRGAVV